MLNNQQNPRHAARGAKPWPLALRIFAPLVVASAFAFAAAPPADTRIGNVATATYTDASNTSRTATSNPVTTVVQQVSSFTLTQDQSKLAAPGGQVYFPHTVVNTGNGSDSFTLSVANNGGDNFDLTSLALFADGNGDGLPDDNTPITTTGPVAAGASFKFVAVGIIPGNALATQTAGVTVTATAVGNGPSVPGAPAQTNTDTVTVTNNAVIDVFKSVDSSSGAAGSGPHTFTLTYTNNGNATATGFILTDTIPAGMIYVPGSARWSVTGPGTTLTDAAGGVQGAGDDTIVYDFGQTTANTVTANINRVLPGETRTLTFQVTIETSRTAGKITNVGNYTYDPDGPGGTPNVGPYPTNPVDFVVTQTAAVRVDDSVVPSATQGGTVSFTNPVTNLGNGSDIFNIAVANSGFGGNPPFPAGTTFQLFKSDGNTPLVDTNNDNIPDTGTLAAGAVYNVVVKAILPPGASGTNVNYTAVVTGTSTVDATKSDTGLDRLASITANTVDLTNNAAAPGGLGVGAGPEAGAVVTNTTNPGTTTRFSLFVTNTSAVTDTFNLAASTDSAFAGISLPTGWTVTFRDTSGAVVTSTGPIVAGGNRQVFADVTIPVGQAPGTTDLYFRAQSPTTGATDRIHDAVTVSTVRALALSGTNSGQVAPGSSMVYAHVLTNNGNVTEGDAVGSNVALSTANNAAGWSSIAYFDTNGNGIVDAGEPVIANTATTIDGTPLVTNGGIGLAPGESMNLVVKVTAPPGAPIGSQNATTITATTSNVGYATPAPAVVTATDTTTVINGDVTLLKEQALDAANDGTPDAAYSTGSITSGARPGAGIRYRITVTNGGTAPATQVIVFDSTPAYTAYTTTGPAAINGTASGAPTIQAPANGSAGALRFDVGTLNPGQSAVITFGVTIDQ